MDKSVPQANDEHHGDEPTKNLDKYLPYVHFMCTVCKFSCETQHAVLQHIAETHSLDIVPHDSTNQTPVKGSKKSQQLQRLPHNNMKNFVKQQRVMPKKIVRWSRLSEKARTCAFCLTKFDTTTECLDHYVRDHAYYEHMANSTKKVDQLKDHQYYDPICKSSYEHDQLRINKRNSTNVVIEKCPFCHKEMSKHRLDVHIQISHIWKKIGRKKETKGCFICEHCSKEFCYQRNLKQHIEIKHLGTRKARKKSSPDQMSIFMCEQCGYTSPEKRRLDMHILSFHNGVLPFQCTYCDFKTAERTSFRDHSFRHQPEKPYKCNECNYQCIQHSSLRTHLFTQHNIVLPKKRHIRNSNWRERKAQDEFIQNSLQQLSSADSNSVQSKSAELIEARTIDLQNLLSGHTGINFTTESANLDADSQGLPAAADPNISTVYYLSSEDFANSIAGLLGPGANVDPTVQSIKLEIEQDQCEPRQNVESILAQHVDGAVTQMDTGTVYMFP